ncbi:hypothetical protein [Tenacibaculum sp. nBUS_03]|uniref:hypothetical protein n=1 Tax=Tenacibaculum sp. nBUS_03 TaxID=3395320 RepID=UPI003EBAC9A0
MSIFKIFKRNTEKSESKSEILTPIICEKEIDEQILKQINDIDWENFETAYGNAHRTIPNYLKSIYCEDIKIALEATHQLWCSLCHQHAYISSASLPAYEIIRNRLIGCNEKLKVELLDIMLGFASCAKDKTDDKKYNELISQMKIKIVKDKGIFEKYTQNQNDDIKEFAELITEQIKNYS